MSDPVGITGFGGYIPRRRLTRKSIAEANSWINPGLMARAKGERSMANWDEDSVTMAVEAARDCLGKKDRREIDAVYLASTTLPFADRLNAGIVTTALSLDESAFGMDVTSSQKAGLSAIYAAYSAIASGIRKNALVVASDQRKTRAGATQEMQFGDGAAAIVVGTDNVLANFIGHASSTIDFVDHFRGDGEDFDYQWEERWIRDEGLSKLVPDVIKKALASAGLDGSDIDHFIFPCVFPRLDQKLATLSGIDPSKVRDNLASNCGETGAAHTLVMLTHCLESAQPGEKIVMAAFGQGVEAVVVEVTDSISSYRPRAAFQAPSLTARKRQAI